MAHPEVKHLCALARGVTTYAGVAGHALGGTSWLVFGALQPYFGVQRLFGTSLIGNGASAAPAWPSGSGTNSAIWIVSCLFPDAPGGGGLVVTC